MQKIRKRFVVIFLSIFIVFSNITTSYYVAYCGIAEAILIDLFANVVVSYVGAGFRDSLDTGNAYMNFHVWADYEHNLAVEHATDYASMGIIPDGLTYDEFVKYTDIISQQNSTDKISTAQGLKLKDYVLIVKKWAAETFKPIVDKIGEVTEACDTRATIDINNSSLVGTLQKMDFDKSVIDSFISKMQSDKADTIKFLNGIGNKYFIFFGSRSNGGYDGHYTNLGSNSSYQVFAIAIPSDTIRIELKYHRYDEPKGFSLNGRYIYAYNTQGAVINLEKCKMFYANSKSSWYESGTLYNIQSFSLSLNKNFDSMGLSDFSCGYNNPYYKGNYAFVGDYTLRAIDNDNSESSDTPIVPIDNDYSVDYPTSVIDLSDSDNVTTKSVDDIGADVDVTDIGLTSADTISDTIADTIADTTTDTDTKTDSLADTATDVGEKIGDTTQDAVNKKKANMKYAIDLSDYFPFCIPFDIYDMLVVLRSTPEAPHFVFNLPMLGIDNKIDIDLSAFDTVAFVLRKMEILLFMVGLGYATNKLIKH